MINHVITRAVYAKLPSTPLLTRVDAIARAYHSRNKWADRDDLIQVARITAISAMRLWDPFRGTPLQAYVSAAVKRALWGHILQQRTVTHNPSREPAPRDTDITLHEQTRSNPIPCLQAIASALAGNDIAYRALISGEAPREISERSGIPVGAVYAAIARGRCAIRESAVCARAYAESLGMECSPLVWHDPELLFQAACRAGIHKSVFSAKSLKSLMERHLGAFPADYKLPHGFLARMKRAQALRESRIDRPEYMPGIQARYQAKKACTPAKRADLLEDLRKALHAAQGTRCKERIWTVRGLLSEVQALLEDLPRHTPTYTQNIKAGTPGQSYRDRWQTTVCQIFVDCATDRVEMHIGRSDYGSTPKTMHSVYAHLETVRTVR